MAAAPPALGTIAREWGRIGVVGFGGPPAHIVLLRDLCVTRRGWIADDEFEDAIAATNLLPGPGSTQMAIFCGWRVGGVPGALVAGAGFILPGLVLILALASVFLAAAPPAWIRGAGAGAGAAVAAVAVQAGRSLLGPGWTRVRARPAARARWAAYVLAGATAAALAGAWTVLVLLGCGAGELVLTRSARSGRGPADGGGSATHGRGVGVQAAFALPALVTLAAATGGVGALVWVAFKVGALSYGGGFVIIPLMRADAVGHFHWMTDTQFANGVALGQVTPGPVVHTVATVGYAAHGVGGGLLAAVVAFAPSFSFILIGAERFDRLRGDAAVRGFLAGAGPAAIGAILGSAVPLVGALAEPWQAVVLAGAAALLLVAGRGVLLTLVVAGAAGAVIALAGGPLPS